MGPRDASEKEKAKRKRKKILSLFASLSLSLSLSLWECVWHPTHTWTAVIIIRVFVHSFFIYFSPNKGVLSMLLFHPSATASSTAGAWIICHVSRGYLITDTCIHSLTHFNWQLFFPSSSSSCSAFFFTLAKFHITIAIGVCKVDFGKTDGQ